MNGIRIAYERTGHGYPVLLLHGYPQTWRMWRNAASIPNAGRHSPEEQSEATVEHILRFADALDLP